MFPPATAMGPENRGRISVDLQYLAKGITQYGRYSKEAKSVVTLSPPERAESSAAGSRERPLDSVFPSEELIFRPSRYFIRSEGSRAHNAF